MYKGKRQQKLRKSVTSGELVETNLDLMQIPFFFVVAVLSNT